jgi:hypothetical protein
MRIAVGTELLGDYEDEVHIGGLAVSAEGDTQTGRAQAGGMARLRDRGNPIVTINVPTKRAFESVSEAEKWIMDTAQAGGYSGVLTIEYPDGSDTRFPWAVARPTGLSHMGLLVVANWNIQAGEKLV